MTKKDAAKKVAKKEQETKKKPLKSSIKKTEEKKTVTKKKVDSVKKNNIEKKKNVKKQTNKKVAKEATLFPVVEYYDLPYRYDQTTVKVLAQTPKVLFVYWDISDNQRKNFIETYGENFFDNSYPVLIVRNTTFNYSYEVAIDDFSNSWYLHISDPNSHYVIDYGRKLKNNSNEYLYITTSNVVEAPNDHVLLEKVQEYVEFVDVKTGYSKKIKFEKTNVYNIYKDLSKELIHSMPSSNMLFITGGNYE